MRWVVALLAAALALSAGSHAYPQGQAQLVTSCGAAQQLDFKVGQVRTLTMDLNGNLCAGNTTIAATAAATLPALSAGPSSLYTNLLGQLQVDHPTLDTTGPGVQSMALRVVPANGSILNIIAPDMFAPSTAISSSGTPSLSIVATGTSTVNLVLTNASGLSAIFQCSVNGSFQAIAGFNHATGNQETTTTGNGFWTFPSAGCSSIVVTAQAGSATAVMQAGLGMPVPPVDNAVYLATPQTLTNGAVAPLTITNDQQLRVLDALTGGCAGQTPANTNVTQINNAASSANLKLVSKVAAKKVYICALNLIAAAAVNVALVEGSLTTNQCDTSTAGLAGGATAATGWNLAANGGLAPGNGQGILFKSGTANLDVCLFFSAAVQVSGAITWAQF